MGARVYLPISGRFLQVDAIEGGVDNNYVYPPDPVNDFDLDGNAAVPGQYVASPTIAYHMDCQLHGMGSCLSHALTAVLFAIPGGAEARGVGLAANAARGAKVEKLAYALARVRYPIAKIQRQAYTKTSLGPRVIDIKVTGRVTKKVIAIEVKAGKSAYRYAQRQKDQWLARKKGYITKLWQFTRL